MSARAKERHLKRTLCLALDLVDALIQVLEENEIDALWASEMYAQLHYDEQLYSGKKVGERPDTMQV